ncbi:short-chain collagen C4-like [Ruditapes philippinarum]|uniref:short-chain collagen C4-like n=1 Tax=Ruditapes philippinarum TaxID=129788 RepID=UPI00295A9233|nr:short-chain collagen C4-like [Ruditapes philippinarum]
MLKFLTLFLFVRYITSVEPSAKKRLVLHSEEDVAQTIAKLQNELDALKKQISRNGVTYVRWGRNSCPLDNELVYTGYTAGKHYDGDGSGSTNLCLPKHPTWGRYVDGNYHGYRGHIFGTEIDIVEPNHIFPYAVSQQDVPCAVCESPRSKILMTPAMKECHSNWTMEYGGYLMAGTYDKSGAYDYVCMDTEPEFIPHGGTNDNQHILYLVEAQCGSLPCPPYVQGRELACVVCSK